MTPPTLSSAAPSSPLSGNSPGVASHNDAGGFSSRDVASVVLPLPLSHDAARYHLSRAGARETRQHSRNSALLLNGPRVSHALAALSRLSSKGTPARSTFPGVLTQPDAGTFPEVCHV